MAIVEICLEDIESAIAAQCGGADRIELCDNLAVGGTTPSIGMIQQVRQQLQIDLQVLVRPRGGDFCYTDLEFGVMKADVEAAKSAGADGIVTGILNTDGTIDVQRTQELIRLALPIPVTFHRAFDHTPNPLSALETLAGYGISRILSSGQASSAYEGLSLLSQLQKTARGRISIMAGGGVNSWNAPQIVRQARISEIHTGSSCMQRLPGKMSPQHTGVTIDHRNLDNTYPQVSVELVRQLVASVRKINTIEYDQEK
ncbi:copper homeostasis protein CutC [Candidatus Poribacteria bacterium]|nr:copper homeostasis protein CutC [Candidatus Poribacteria bacterium]MDP6598500.1 copper homeostasis protein CutC [Candidatus Poribacteria bacterium]MDP6748943.1 copper homeostasis protein CutC [Candidatus Poribacteria bacterium]MDP6998806.1 copper homeostasis protein CutC [Candidatus Poribacteria bacterium]